MQHQKADVRARAEREHALLDGLVRRLQPSEWAVRLPRPENVEPWTVKDAFAHVVYWKSHTARVIRGERLPDPLRGLCASELNMRVYLDWKDEPVKAVLAWHERVQLQVLDAIDGRSDDWFRNRLRSPFWPSDLESHSAGHRLRDIEAVLQ